MALLQEVEAIQAWHFDIEKHQLRAIGFDFCQRLLRIVEDARHVDVGAVFFEHHAQQIRAVAFVVDQEGCDHNDIVFTWFSKLKENAGACGQAFFIEQIRGFHGRLLSLKAVDDLQALGSHLHAM